MLIGLRAMRAARIALHVEKAKDGLVAVTLGSAGTAGDDATAGTDEAAIAAENAATPTVTVVDR